MLGRYENRTWQYDPSLNAPLRFRRACNYATFIPSPIDQLEVSFSGSLAATVSLAEAAIQELNAQSHPALDPLARLLLRTESVASSKVEGMQIDVRSLARAEVSAHLGQRATPTALEVIGNIDAMQLAIENANAEATVGVDQLVEIHRALLEKAPNSHIAGRIRSEQNWIGGNDYNPCGADFVPPPPEEVDALLHDLSNFCSDDRLPPLIQAAIAHAQFETIHPFGDGNGRTGRALVQVILRRRELAPSYVPPISVVLATNKEQYISGLTAYREGRIEAWIEVFAVAATRAAHLARHYLQKIETLQEQWRSMLRASGRVRTDAAAWRIIDALPAQPVVTLPTVVARIGRTKPAANQAIEQLVSAGVLLPLSTGKRNRAWEAAGLFELLTRLEEGEPAEGQPDLEPLPDVSQTESSSVRVVDEQSQLGGEGLKRRLPYSDPIYRLAPGSWLAPPGEEPDLTLRVAIALPGVLPIGGSGSTQIVTKLRGQRREELLVDLLNASPLTPWLRSFSAKWHWADHPDWLPLGSGSPEFTEIWFAPFGIDNRRPPLMARCGFATGAVDDDLATSAPSLQSAIDLLFNLRSTSADAIQPSTRHELSASALSVTEVADGLVHLLDFVDVAALAAKALLNPPTSTTARVGAWLSASGGLDDRVIDLSMLRRNPRSTGLAQAVGTFSLDIGNSQLSIDDAAEFVADFLYEGLERAGYRDPDEVIQELKGLTFDGGDREPPLNRGHSVP